MRVFTKLIPFQGMTQRWPFVSSWMVRLGLGAAIFWNLRHRAVPITVVARQITHIRDGSMIASSMRLNTAICRISVYLCSA